MLKQAWRLRMIKKNKLFVIWQYELSKSVGIAFQAQKIIRLQLLKVLMAWIILFCRTGSVSLNVNTEIEFEHIAPNFKNKFQMICWLLLQNL
jgi:hypothetical protein